MKKIAYLILVHSDPVQFGRLCKALNHSFIDVYVHIDAKCANIKAFKDRSCSNTFFLDKRISVSWAGISMIDAQNLLITEVLKNSRAYSLTIFLSGSCYPIKNQRAFYEIITNTHSFQRINMIDMRESPEHYLKHIMQKWFMEPVLLHKSLKQMTLLNKAMRKLLQYLKFKNHWHKDMIPYFGSQWIVLTIDCCEYLIDFQKKNPWFREMNAETFSPDEHYFHTIIGNSKYFDTLCNVKDYEGRGTWQLANLHLIDNSLSKWFTNSDWESITSSDKFFVRKVRSIDGSELVDRIERELLN